MGQVIGDGIRVVALSNAYNITLCLSHDSSLLLTAKYPIYDFATSRADSKNVQPLQLSVIMNANSLCANITILEPIIYISIIRVQDYPNAHPNGLTNGGIRVNNI